MINSNFKTFGYTFLAFLSNAAAAQEQCFVQMNLSEMRPAFSDELIDYRGGFLFSGGQAYIQSDSTEFSIDTAAMQFSLRTAEDHGPDFEMNFGRLQSQVHRVILDYFRWVSSEVETSGADFNSHSLVALEGENILARNDDRTLEELYLIAVSYSSVLRTRQIAERRLEVSLDAAVRALDTMLADTSNVFGEISITVFEDREIPIDFHVGLLEARNSIVDLRIQESLLIDRGSRELGEYLQSLQLCQSDCLVSFLDRGVVGSVSLTGETIGFISYEPDRWLIPLSEISNLEWQHSPQPLEIWLFRDIDPTVNRVAEGPRPSQDYLREDYMRSLEEGYHLGLSFNGEVVGEEFAVVQVSDFSHFWSILRRPELPRLPFPITVQGEGLAEILIPYGVFETPEGQSCPGE